MLAKSTAATGPRYPSIKPPCCAPHTCATMGVSYFSVKLGKTPLIQECDPKGTCTLTFNNKKTNSLIKKWAKDLNRHLTKENVQMVGKHLTGCSTSHAIRETQTRTMRYHDTPVRMAQIQSSVNAECR